MSPMPTVSLRVDASAAIGLGHLRRSVTLAGQLRDNGCNVRLVCRYRFGTAIATLAETHAICWLDEHSPVGVDGTFADDETWDADATLSMIGSDRVDHSWVVLDSYRLGHRWERRVRDAGHRVVVIDDFRNRMHHADLLVSDSEVPFESRLNERSDTAQTLVGREYALIGPEYEYVNTPAIARSERKRLLIAYGGSDNTGETMKAMTAVKMLRGSLTASHLMGRVEIAVGHFNSIAADIVRTASGINDCVVHVAPHGLARLMRDADLILTGGGNSMVEGLALRKPCLVTVTSDNQMLMVDELAAQGVIRTLGVQDTVIADDVAEAIVDILTKYEVFAGQVTARPVFDHLGARRIAAAILRQSGLEVRRSAGSAPLPGAG